jgi:acetyl esterase
MGDAVALPGHAPAAFQTVAIAGPHGEVPARLYRRGDLRPAAAALVWVHGGAFVSGDLDMPEAHWVAQELAARGVTVLSLDYRKAVLGVRYPVPSDDVLAGWSWATEHVNRLGVIVDRVHLGGASAGANLVAGVTKRLRDGAGRLPASVVLAYPVVHAELPESAGVDLVGIARRAGDLFFSPDTTRRMALNYVGDAHLFADPYAFASNGDVSGQPPVYVLNCEDDSLRASGHAYVTQLECAGVNVYEETLPRSRHGVLNRPGTDDGCSGIERIARWLIDGPIASTADVSGAAGAQHPETLH